MWPVNSFNIGFTIIIFFSDVYRNWKQGEPDNQHDAVLFFKSLLAVGLKPIRVVVSPDGIELWFQSWSEMEQADIAIRHVLDLMWLIE